MAIEHPGMPGSYSSLRALLNPRAQMLPLLAALGIGLALAALGVGLLSLPLWTVTILMLALLAYPVIRKWQDDRARFGVPLMILSILLALQGFHGIEHIAQYIELHMLGWPPRQSSGLISPLNAEIIHFTWNWSVVVLVIYLLRSGLRNAFGWLLLAWSLAHSLEHTYLLVQYLNTIRILWATGGYLGFAQGLPGVLGREGWLWSHGNIAPVGFVCRLAPAIIELPRLDIHFWWNVGETVLLYTFAAWGMGWNRWGALHREH